MKRARFILVGWTLLWVTASACQLTTPTDSFSGLICAQRQLQVDSTKSLAIGYQSYNGTTIAQTIRTAVSVDQVVTKVKLGLYRQGWPNGQLTFRIQTDNGGSPSGVDVSADTVKTLSYTSNETLQTSTFKTYPEYFDFDFTNAVTLTKDTTYWMLLKTSAAVNSSTYVLWAGMGNNPYTSGSAFYENTTTGSPVFTNAAIGTDRDTVFAMCSPSPTPTETATTAAQYFSPEPPAYADETEEYPEPTPEPTL